MSFVRGSAANWMAGGSSPQELLAPRGFAKVSPGRRSNHDCGQRSFVTPTPRCRWVICFCRKCGAFDYPLVADTILQRLRFERSSAQSRREIIGSRTWFDRFDVIQDERPRSL